MGPIFGDPFCWWSIYHCRIHIPNVYFHQGIWKFHFLAMQWNLERAMPCCSSVFILMQLQIPTACMGAALLLRVRSGRQPSGFTWDPLINHRSMQTMGIVWMRMRTALYGLRMVSVKRTVFTWWALRTLMDTVGRVARFAHPRKTIFQFFLSPIQGEG
jgi:hypothetical protein